MAEAVECRPHSGHTATTRAHQHDNFASEDAALAALISAVMPDIEADRQAHGKRCGDRTCDAARLCETTLYQVGLQELKGAVYSYGNPPKWGYEWPGGDIESGCRCIPRLV